MCDVTDTKKQVTDDVSVELNGSHRCPSTETWTAAQPQTQKHTFSPGTVHVRHHPYNKVVFLVFHSKQCSYFSTALQTKVAVVVSMAFADVAVLAAITRDPDPFMRIPCAGWAVQHPMQGE